MRLTSTRTGAASGSSSGGASSSSSRHQAPRLQRQTSVLHDFQETHDKENLELRNARLVTELSALCSDRDNVLTPESLDFLANGGRVEPVKLEREPEKPADALLKAAQSTGKQDDLLSADAARRQRVEELTRFFMEARSDIEFALGGGRDLRKSRDKDAESERDDEKDGDDDDEEDDLDQADENGIDPKRSIARRHFRLIKDKVDDRVFNAMLVKIRETDPALYGAILCHPLVTGVDPRKDKQRKKKRRKDRERKPASTSAPSVAPNASVNTMLSPDFVSPRLDPPDVKLNVARFVAKAVADGSIQGLLLATKLVISWIDSHENEAAELTLPVATHLRVLRGESAPEYPPRVSVESKSSAESDVKSPSGEGVTAASELTNEDESSVTTMEVDVDSESHATLQVRLSRFGDHTEDDHHHDDHSEADEDEEEDEDDDDEDSIGGGEAVDEDALMARAIALSLSPEMNLRDQADTIDSPHADAMSLGTPTTESTNARQRPAPNSSEEILSLGPFLLPVDELEVDAITVAVCLTTQISQICGDYLDSCRRGRLPSGSGVQPHPIVFMLINSVLRELLQAAPKCLQADDWQGRWKLFVSCALSSLLCALEAHFFHVDITSMSPGSVGLGHSSGRPTSRNKLVDCLKASVEESIGVTEYLRDDKSDTVTELLFAREWTIGDLARAHEYYGAQVRENGLLAWTRGLAHFYPTQASRHQLIAELLDDCLRILSATRPENEAQWKFRKLDLLCARLAMPDLVTGFVPQCGDVIVSTIEGKTTVHSAQDSGIDTVKVIDDVAISSACQKNAKISTAISLWHPEVIRASLQSGSVTSRCLLDFLSEISSPELLEVAGISGLIVNDSQPPDVLAQAYEQLWEAYRREQRDSLDCLNRLPGLLDSLREAVLQQYWPRFSFDDHLAMPHAPLFPQQYPDQAVKANSRLLLLRSIQDLMLVRIGGPRGDEPPALEFDPTRCAETMTLSDGNKTARQYTAKQWGMVMATTGCPPNSGIHEWAVRLDRCEKGHIFLGVCAREASVATYVGGDRQGWGLIGTRALWHNRSKVRGDYGDGFSTGTVVRVRLNTDSGALSFGVDDSDWGIAFDGLTQHGTLFPAIGLYQRDDQVTILPVRSSDADVSDDRTSSRNVREVIVPAILHPFLHHVAAVVDSSCKFLRSSDIDNACREAISARSPSSVDAMIKNHPLLLPLLNPLVSTLSTIKNFHGLSGVLAWHMIPWFSRLLRQIDWLVQQVRDVTQDAAKKLSVNVSGEWELKSMAAGNIPAQQYHLTLVQGSDGQLTGKSSGSFTTVTLSGAVTGTRIRFMETWRQGGTCLVEGRLRVDASAFVGTYEDAKSHTSGSIVGFRVNPSPTDSSEQTNTSLTNLAVLEVVCANLVGMFSRSLMDCQRPDIIIDQFTRTALAEDDVVVHDSSTISASNEDGGMTSRFSECSSEEYEGWVDSMLLSGGLPSSIVNDHVKDLMARITETTRIEQEVYSMPELAIGSNEWLHSVVPKSFSSNSSASFSVASGLEQDIVQDLIQGRGAASQVDRWVSRHVGESPFLRLGGEPMKVAKRTVCAAMLWHGGFLDFVEKLCNRSAIDELGESEERPHDNLMHIWRAAQRVIEWGIRAKNTMGSTYAVIAALVIRKAEFLLKIEPSGKAVAASTAVAILAQDSHGGPITPARSAVNDYAERIFSEVLMQISRFLEAPIRISSLQSRMLAHSTQAFLRVVGMMSFRYFVGDSGSASTTTRDVLKSSFALSVGLQWLSPSLSSSSTTASIPKDNGASSEIGEGSPSANGPKEPDGHFLAGLGGCGKQLEGELRDAFESLYGFLSAALSKATWARDTDLQLVLLQAWGISIRPDDHAFLSRVGVFRVLQTVLDDARTQEGGFDALPAASLTEGRSRAAEARKNVVQATLKVVHLLAAQVAHVGEVADTFSAPSTDTISSVGPGAIPLLRKPSGPETLGKSVFNMLYTEMKNALEDIRARNDAASPNYLVREETQIPVEPTEIDQGPSSNNDTEVPGSVRSLNDSEEYCYQICTLLYSVSGSSVCRSHLSSSRWLRLLLVLLEIGNVQIQRRSLKLLRRILPELDPTTLKLRPDAMDGLDIDSDDDVDSDDSSAQDQATTLINLFMSAISSMCPPSVVEAMISRLNQSNDTTDTTTRPWLSIGAASGLAGEVVLLLRSLYESSKWSKPLSSVLSQALKGVASIGKNTKRGLETRDSDADVDMDVSGPTIRDLPTLDEWNAQSRTELLALSALCVLDGHIESLRIGATVKILPRGISSSGQDATFRGARGVVVSYDYEKSSAEVLIKPSRVGDGSSLSHRSTSSTTRPIRVPVEDLVPAPEVELDASVFSDDVLSTLLVSSFPYFIDEIKRSQETLNDVECLDKTGDPSLEEPDDDDDMSNDGSIASPNNAENDPMSTPAAVDSIAVSGEVVSEVSHSNNTVDLDGVIEPADVVREIDNESQLQRMLLCQHGLRSISLLLRDKRAAEVFIRSPGGESSLFQLLQVAISKTPTAGLVEVSTLEESWVFLWSRWFQLRRSAAFPSPKKSTKNEEPNEAADKSADEGFGLSNPMIQQMMEMGFPKEWCEVALMRCSQNVEAAINFCFEHSSDMERLVSQYKSAKEAAAAGSSNGSKSVSRAEAEAILISPLLEQLAEMGFPPNWCKKALAANRNNVDAALTWILSNGEALEAEDRREEEAKQRLVDGIAGSTEESGDPVVDSLKPNPLRAVSGQATIGESDSMVEGLVGAGFPSVGAPDCLVSSGRWYYEATLLTNGCIQIGWADVAFNDSADRGDGVGDGAHSWAYDGWRQQKWHGQSSPWGAKWKQGDVVGCGVDVDAGTILFSLNGKMKSINMGVAFRGIDFAHGIFPCASFNRRERLQFNLGGSPFKFSPPPGFRPILEVLCKEGETISDLPKGFAVIGRAEDCLEESVGDENYSSDARYFGREVHPSIGRTTGTSSSSRGNGILTGSSRAEALAELKAIPDDRVFVELLLLTRSLAILHARRALLTILTKWPSDVVGDFSMKFFSLRSSPGYENAEASSMFIEFVKLIAGCSGGMGGPDTTESEEEIDVGWSGRYALNLLGTVSRSSIDSALAMASRTGGNPQLLDVVLSRITSEVQLASERTYARVPWDTSEALVTASFLQLSSESGQVWSDKEVVRHPNIFLAEWLSRLLLDSLSRHDDRVDEKTQNYVRVQLLKAWLAAFKSPGLCVKEKAFGIIGGILQDTLLKATLLSPSARDLIHQVLHALPLQRLVNLADERLLKEYPQLPVCSRYLQSIVELISAGSLASSIVGIDTETLFTREVRSTLAASRHLDADLFAIDAKECEEEANRRRLEAEEAKEKAAREEAAKAAAEAEAKSANDAASTTTALEGADQLMQDSLSSPANQDDNDNNNESIVDSASNMEVDSDSEDNSDLTLSAIADMVAEDSDVVSAAAAIAAATRGRLTIKHSSKRLVSDESKPVSAVDTAVAETMLPFPEEELAVDTSILSDQEKLMVDAGVQGILGDEPMEWKYGPELGLLSDTATQIWSGQLTQHKMLETAGKDSTLPELTVGCKVIRGPNWKWRDQDGGEGSVGIVEGVSPWSGVEGEGMSVRWPNDSLFTYRWGADGNFDLIHVEVDNEGNVITKYPTPQVKPEEEGTFGCELHLGVLLHLFEDGSANGAEGSRVVGVMEFPDFGAAVRVTGVKSNVGRTTIILQELQLIRGSPDMGWTMRFGSEKWLPGTKYTLSALEKDGVVDDAVLYGDYTHQARRNGKLVEVRGELRVTTKTLFTMDSYNHFSTLTVSDEGMTVTCNSGESRNLALGTVGFATGVHYWEVRVDQAEFGSVFIGVCEKAGPPGSPAALSNRLNRWTGWGFVNFRATYHNSTERIYGDHFNAGDTIGVRLDMEQGKLAFFMDGMKFGEHIVADLGVAFDNMKGERNSRTLYPCIGMRKSGDRVALNGKWVSVPGVASKQLLRDVLDVSASLHSWYLASQLHPNQQVHLSDRLIRESWNEWKRWSQNRWQRYPVRPRGVLIDFDTYPSSCVAVSKAAGLGAPFLAGDRVRICSTYGRELTQPEEAVILGVYRGSLWYRTETQGNEGSDEGRSWAWYFSASELAELLLIRRNGKDMTLIENNASDLDEESLAVEAAFTPQSDLEKAAFQSLDAFIQLAVVGHTPASDMQLVERLNVFCSASGVDITNLRIGDIATPSEASAKRPQPRRPGDLDRPGARPFVHDEYFSSPALKAFSGPQLRARCAVLRVFNGKVARALPLLALQPSEPSKDAIEVSATSREGSSGSTAVNTTDYPSTSLKLRAMRRLVFTSTKRSFWDAVIRATTTSTPLPSDEYEDPREIRTIRINRIQAQASKLSLLAQPSDRLRRSVFGQLYREMRTWNDSSFRRAYCGKGHGGQKRAFKVKFLGEGVNDYGGPYRAVFEQVVDELQMDNVELSKGEQGLLPLLIPSPNRRSGTGSNQDKFLLNPSCGTSLVSSGPVALDLHRFLGKIIGTAVRHGLQMGLDLPALVWRPLAGLDVNRAHLESVDVVAANNLTLVEDADAANFQDAFEYLTFSTTLSDGTEVTLCPNGDKIRVTPDNRSQFVQLVEKKRLTESHLQLAALRDGLSAVLPMELAPLFTPRELEVLICGRREVDVELLRQCTEYGDSVDESMAHVQAFWEVLKEMSSEERTSFLRFVWARSRMPNSAKDFPMNFKIQSAHDSGAQVDPDKYLPHAQTCFFALRLPNYTSKDILREKLLYAIQNSPNMDADVRLHNAEGWADA